MKKIFFYFLAIVLVSLYSCTNKGDNASGNKQITVQDSTKEVWADVVETKTILIKPDSWEDDYWNSVNVNMSNKKIFNTLVDAVISGKKQAYNLFTDSLFTIDEVKAMVDQNDIVSGENKVKASDLSMIRMREKWVFDKEKFKLEKQVTRIDLLFKKLDENGEYIGDKPLFYINLND
jgi:hypothetical protein